MKQAILTILARLINAMKAESVPLHSMVIPIIKNTLEPGSDTQVYLLEDALDLWDAVLKQTPAPASPEVISLAPYLIPTLELGSESLRKTLEIAEVYLLLAPTEMCSDNLRTTLLTSLCEYLSCGIIHRLRHTDICSSIASRVTTPRSQRTRYPPRGSVCSRSGPAGWRRRSRNIDRRYDPNPILYRSSGWTQGCLGSPYEDRSERSVSC